MTTQVRKADYLFRVGHHEGVSHHHLVVAETPRQAEEWERFMAEQGEVLVFPDGRLLAWGSRRWARCPMCLLRSHVWLSLAGFKLVVHERGGHTLRQLSVPEDRLL